MPHDRYFDIPEHVLTRKIDSETVILDMNRSVYCGLDEVGTRFLELITDSKSYSEALSCLHDEYDVSLATLEADLEEFVGELLEKKLIVKLD